MRRQFLCLVYLIFTLVTCGAHADQGGPAATDPTLEKHVTRLAEELRCLVCQNQTIADSQADLAIDLKNQVREKLAQGLSDKEVIEFMVQRYGDFVLYRPPVKSATWLLWFGPFLLLLFGLIFLIIKLRQTRVSTEELSSAEMKRGAVLLTENSALEEFQ